MERGTQQEGDVYLQGGFWRLRWREDEINTSGFVEGHGCKPTWIGPATGPERLTKKEAQQIAWDNFLPRLNQNAAESAMTIGDFVEKKFVPEHVAKKKLSGRTHYHAILKHVLKPEEVDRVFQVDAEKSRTKLKAVANWPYLSNVRLCDIRPDDVQRLISAAIARKYSTQTVKHIRNVVSAIFEHAKKERCFTGDNPARLVTLPGMTREQKHTLKLDQVKEILDVMQYPEKEMTLFALLTSMNIAEICGLQWKRVNLTEAWSNTDGEPVPPRNIAVRKQWYCGELGSVVKRSRHRNVPIPEPLLPVLLGLSHRVKHVGPDDFVLVSRTGMPVTAANIAARRLRPIGKVLQMPWLSWHVLRRTYTALRYELGTQFLERMAMLGHSDARMTSALMRSDPVPLSYSVRG